MNIVYCIVDWMNRHGDLAAWVQAVGSILAILASAGLVHWQHRLEEAARREREQWTLKERIASVFQIVGGTVRVVEKLIDPSETNLLRTSDLRQARLELEGLRDVLKRVDVSLFHAHAPIVAVLVATSATSEVIHWLDALMDIAVEDRHEHIEDFYAAVEGSRDDVLKVLGPLNADARAAADRGRGKEAAKAAGPVH